LSTWDVLAISFIVMISILGGIILYNDLKTYQELQEKLKKERGGE